MRWYGSLAAVAALLTVVPATAAQAAPAGPGGRILYLQLAATHGTGELMSAWPDGTRPVDHGLALAWYSGSGRQALVQGSRLPAQLVGPARVAGGQREAGVALEGAERAEFGVPVAVPAGWSWVTGTAMARPSRSAWRGTSPRIGPAVTRPAPSRRTT